MKLFSCLKTRFVKNLVDKVFISHKSTDTNQAEAVAKRVIASGMEVYLDSIDSALYKDGPDLADYLLRRMKANIFVNLTIAIEFSSVFSVVQTQRINL